jgi:hypothetical protein
MSNDLNKVKAYKRVAKNYYEAVGILNDKKLAFGEPAVVPFYYPDKSDLDRVIRLAVGYGSINGGVEILSNINNSTSKRIDDAECEMTIDGEQKILTMSEAFDYILRKLESVDDQSIPEEEITDIIIG